MLSNECMGPFIPLNLPSLQDRTSDLCNDDMCVQQIFDIKFRNRQNAGVIMPLGNLSGNIYIIKRDASGHLQPRYGPDTGTTAPPHANGSFSFSLIQVKITSCF